MARTIQIAVGKCPGLRDRPHGELTRLLDDLTVGQRGIDRSRLFDRDGNVLAASNEKRWLSPTLDAEARVIERGMEWSSSGKGAIAHGSSTSPLGRGHGYGDRHSPEALGQIFEPFYTTKPVGPGTRLGLAISRDIIRDHGGTVVAQSRPGQGATFTVWLPEYEALV